MGLKLLIAFMSATVPQGLVFDAAHVDLGPIRAAGTVEHAFRFKVVGDSPAVIDDIRASCGCLKPHVAQRHYRPGQAGEIVMAIHAASQPAGRKRFVLTLEVRDPEPRSVKLTAEADIDSDITINPSNLILYVSGSGPIQQRISIRDRRPKPLEIRHVRTSDRRIRGQVVAGPSRAGDENVSLVDLRIAGDFPVGESIEVAELRTSDRETPIIEIPIRVVRRPRIYPVPDAVSVDRAILRNRPVIRQIYLRDQQGFPIRIRQASCAANGIECAWPAESDRFPRVRLTLHPTELAVPLETHIQVQLTEPNETELRIPLRID
jgi:hypothetical protein